MAAEHPDIAILGGGLAGGLVALALARWRPDLSVMLFEREATLGGNHVWSYFATDLPPDGDTLIAPLVDATWTGYDVRFPAYTRTLMTPYRATTSHRLDLVLRDVLPGTAIVTGAHVSVCTANSVTLADGRHFTAGAVIDARGVRDMSSLNGGWQKFLGQRLKLARPHKLARPIVMDATVEQIDGYRFVYCLPFARDEVFVEDTYYSDDPALDHGALAGRIADYARAKGWDVLGVLAEEHGVLPVVAGGDFDRLRAGAVHGVALAGTRAGLFHPLTSYSLPDALRFALALARWPDLGRADLAQFAEDYARSHWKQASYYRTLSAMLFVAATPVERYRVLQRFYGLAPRLIERFYAGQSSAIDKVRILSGRPPVPIGAALGVLTGLGPQAGQLNNGVAG
ncbi:lycopene beta-cyclase CrtY [Novosphingobium sp.]|uniref:lycopene beta-cyclase CrtY n=1 Tax=Novosphingobium sp. TaxID=1874826 RepID=UPI003D1029BB